MFSTRFHWDLRPNRLTATLERKRRTGARVLDLTVSNPTQVGLVYPPEVLRALDDPRSLVYEPNPAGLEDTRRTVSAYYAARGVEVPPGRILLTASTSEAYAYLFKLLCNPGDCVLTPRPSYPLFEFLGDMECVRVEQYPLCYQGEWTLEPEAVAQAVSAHARAVVVVSPNNPTGSFLKHGELQELLRICADRKLALISDEVFSDYALSSDPARVRSLAGVQDCLTFTLSGLSKVAGLPQMKLGWVVVNGPEKLREEAIERLEWIADTYLSVATPVQWAAETLLRAGELVQQQIRARMETNLSAARSVLAGSAASLLRLEGGWSLTVQVPRVRSEEEWALRLLTEHNVLVQPGFFFDFASEAFLVVSLLTPPRVFADGIKGLKTCLLNFF